MPVTLIVVAALWGAAAGTLLPRPGYRLSVEPGDPWRDSCPAGHLIRGPVNGWIGGARCTDCAVGVLSTGAGRHEQEGPGRPVTGNAAAMPVPRTASAVVPVVTAVICAALAATTGTRPELAVWLLLAPVAVLLALVDLNVRRLPDQLTLPLAGAATVLLGAAALSPRSGGSWPAALLGGLVLGAVYLALFLINPAGLGFGDVKLALSLGVVLGWYGWTVVFVGAFAGFLLGSLYGAGKMLRHRTTRAPMIPFGPFMAAGALLGLLLGGLYSA